MNVCLALKRAVCVEKLTSAAHLTAETVQGTALALESVDDVHGGDGLALGVLSVGDSVADDVLKENLEYTPSFLVDETGDPLHTSSSGQTTDSRLRDTLDVVTKHFAVPLGASLSQSFTALASARHDSLGAHEREQPTTDCLKSSRETELPNGRPGRSSGKNGLTCFKISRA